MVGLINKSVWQKDKRSESPTIGNVSDAWAAPETELEVT